MMKLLFSCLWLLVVGFVDAQITEHFSDSNFNENPRWMGNTDKWIVNASRQLQSNCSIANQSFFFSTQNQLALTAQWEVSIQLAFNTSSTNYTDVFLTASDSNLLNPTNTGYFVRFGNTEDEVSLYRKDSNAIIKIIDGINTSLNSSNNLIQLKVIRNRNNQWELFRNINNAGFVLEGSSFDSNYITSAYFGFIVKQSTSSFFNKHFFDDVMIGGFYPDTISPNVDSLITSGTNSLDLYFNEEIDSISAETIVNYFVDNNIGMPTYALRDVHNHQKVRLVFANQFPVRRKLTLTVKNISDIYSNIMNDSSLAFLIYIPEVHDILIDEVMADPSPVVGMPDAEWIELRNVSGFNINLYGWKIGKENSISNGLRNWILKPDSSIVICNSSNENILKPFAPTIGVVNFPSLNNTGDVVCLKSPEGKTIHAISYTDDWYKNELKKQGGWSLEMMDLNNPCDGSDNWSASVATTGSSPGTINSIDAINIDDVSPKLLRTYAYDSVHVLLFFNEPVDSISASNTNKYHINNYDGNVITAIAQPPLFDRVEISLSNALLHQKMYTVYVSAVSDCVANETNGSNIVKLSLAEHLDSLDVVINEVLFNPKSEGVDFIEVYNRSNKTINLKNLFIANKNSLGMIDNITNITADDFLFFPEEYMVITSNPFITKRDYVTTNPEAFLKLENIPSFNDDEGTVIILNEQGKIIDNVSYHDNWHFKLLDNTEGVSLERVNTNGNSQEESIWHSASTTVGYATPGYKNSQAMSNVIFNGEITISPKIISPNNDGRDDIAVINYSFPEVGYMANVKIFDANGIMQKYLKNSTLCGTTGQFIWDGLDDKNKKLPTGAYIVFTEAFNLKGVVKKFKNVIIINN